MSSVAEDRGEFRVGSAADEKEAAQRGETEDCRTQEERREGGRVGGWSREEEMEERGMGREGGSVKEKKGVIA